jgi:hypothetical protein
MVDEVDARHEQRKAAFFAAAQRRIEVGESQLAHRDRSLHRNPVDGDGQTAADGSGRKTQALSGVALPGAFPS